MQLTSIRFWQYIVVWGCGCVRACVSECGQVPSRQGWDRRKTKKAIVPTLSVVKEVFSTIKASQQPSEKTCAGWKIEKHRFYVIKLVVHGLRLLNCKFLSGGLEWGSALRFLSLIHCGNILSHRPFFSSMYLLQIFNSFGLEICFVWSGKFTSVYHR